MARLLFGIMDHIIKHPDMDLDAPIYRFMQLDRYKQFVNTKSLYFRRIVEWEDSWEVPSQLLTNGKYDNVDLNNFIKQIVNENRKLYGLCLSNEFNTDAMWRIYSNDKNSVCIQTTMRKLIDSMDKRNLDYGVVGPVLYRYIDKGDHLFNLSESADTYPAICFFPFIKRIEFSHEKEIRLVLRFYGDQIGDGIFLTIDPEKVIEKVILDPRLIESEYNNLINIPEIRNFKVERSKLYERQDLIIDNQEQFWNCLNNINTGWHVVKNDCYYKWNGEWIPWNNEIDDPPPFKTFGTPNI